MSMKIILINTSNRIFGFDRAGLWEGAIAGFKIIYVLNFKDAISVCVGVLVLYDPSSKVRKVST